MTQSFTPGTLVWMKVFNRIWWPGQVVDPTTSPQEMQDFMHRKKNPIAMVYFERDKKYEIAINQDKLSMYNGTRKTEFLEKGYSLYLKQKKGTTKLYVNMEHFIEDVLQFENKINGNIDIFKQYEEKKDEHVPPTKEIIKELFASSKDIKKKESKSRNSLRILKTRFQSKVSRNPTPLTTQKKSMQDQSKIVCSTQTSNTSGTFFPCHVKSGCDFQTTRYERLKLHISHCKSTVGVNDNSLNISAQPGSSTTANQMENNLNESDCKKFVVKNKEDTNRSSSDYESSEDNIVSTSELRYLFQCLSKPVENEMKIELPVKYLNINESSVSVGDITLTDILNLEENVDEELNCAASQPLTGEQVKFREDFLNNIQNGILNEDPYPVNKTQPTFNERQINYFDRFPVDEWPFEESILHTQKENHRKGARNLSMEPNKYWCDNVLQQVNEEEFNPSTVLQSDIQLPRGTRRVTIRSQRKKPLKTNEEFVNSENYKKMVKCLENQKAKSRLIILDGTEVEPPDPTN